MNHLLNHDISKDMRNFLPFQYNGNLYILILFIKASSVVILPEVEFGNGNFSNLVSVKEALSLSKKVIVVETKDIKERDHTGGKAAELYNKILKEGAMRIKTDKQMLDIIKDY